ncbi:hypothetical protein C8J56DRAFT_788320 [Mycena floridula]|nr:hypothetical protein C8J56DRAFT_788320 [Mycena floridula]
MFLCFLFLGLWASSLVQAQFSAARDFWPAAYPLAVRSPYLNTWAASLNGTTNLVTDWPRQWDLASINGWSGLVRVDGVAFKWLGNPPNFNVTVLQSSQVTPTRSIFAVVAGPVLLNITFLSPIEPTDLVKQSLPFSYLSVDITSIDGQAHAVQLYSDISAEWISGDKTSIAVWKTTQTANSVYHQATRQAPVPFEETSNIADDSTVYYGAATSSALSFQSGADADVRGQFSTQGKLLGSQDTTFRGITDRFVVFGLSVDLGTISATTSSVVWALGLVRDPVIEFGTDFEGLQNRSSFFWTQYSSISAAIDSFLADFPNALQRAVALDQQIMGAAQQLSSDYVDLVSLAARQTIAGTDFTVSKTANGSWNMTDVKAFMRDTGESRRINAVETLYAALPTYLCINASWVGLLLDPMLQYQASPSLYRNSFAAPDLGELTSRRDSRLLLTGSLLTSLPDSADMLLMAWAHATFSGDGTLIGRYYNLLKTWADYLVAGTLKPTGQNVRTADGLSKPGMTNLAIKGIIAIRAMASISQAVGKSADVNHYSSTASSYASQWKALAFSSGHLVSTYDASSSPALIYNLFADRLFKFGLIDDPTYAAQTAFYTSEFATAPEFGLPFDGDSAGAAKAQWTLFTATTVTTAPARDALVSMVRTRASFNQTAGAFPALYNVNTGDTTSPVTSGQASPALGAMMSLLSLNLNAQPIVVPPSSSGSSNKTTKKSNAGAIAGGVVGALVIVLLLAAAGVFLVRRRRQHEREQEQPIHQVVLPTPFIGPAVMATGAPVTPGPSESVVHSPTPSSPPGWDMQSLNSSGSQRTRGKMSHSASSRSEEATQLRDEVHNLRREMQELRAQREYDLQPPPLYD